MLQEIAKVTLLKKAVQFGMRHKFLGLLGLGFLAYRNRDAIKRAMSGRQGASTMQA